MAFCNNGPLDVPELLMQADQALYDAKERGRNRVEIASLDLVQKRKESLPDRIVAALVARSAA